MSHSFDSLYYHFVFATKKREPWLGKGARGSLYAHLDGILRGEGVVPLAVNGMPDHVHILARLRPSHRISDLLSALKSVSSGRLKKRPEPELAGFTWQTGYGAFTVSRWDVDLVRAYIENQEEHHKTVTLHDEMVSLLVKHGVEFDEATMRD
jgi:REP element-mobilizing transposase RayT